MLKVENLSKIYGKDSIAVDDVSFEVMPGEIVGFVGHNGAGKTTTIKSIVGILDFEKGNIYIDGIDIKKEPVLCKSKLAYIPDNPDIYENLTGIQYLTFISDVFKIDSSEKINEYAKLFEIYDNLSDVISSYSHGMKQKLVIISALIHDPKLLILDEPFVGLDPKASYILKDIMKKKCSEGISVFFSSHVLEVVEKLCDKVAIIKKGKLVKFDKTEKITKDKSLENIFLEMIEND